MIKSTNSNSCGAWLHANARTATILVFLAACGPATASTDEALNRDIQATLDQFYTEQPRGYFGKNCVSLAPDSQIERSAAFRDTQFDYTPAGFRLTEGAQPDPKGTLKAQREFLVRQGFLESRHSANGAVEYTMTWKGYAESNGYGCLDIHDHRFRPKILSIDKKSGAGDADHYLVTVRSVPAQGASWTNGEEFSRLFPLHATILRGEAQGKSLYVMARHNTQLTIITVNGRVYRPPTWPQGAPTIAAAPDTAQTASAIKTYLQAKGSEWRGNVLCLRLPEPKEVDQVIRVPAGTAGGPDHTVATYSIYRIPGRPTTETATKQRGYTWLRRLETLGLVTAEDVHTTSFDGQAATGVTHFHVKQKDAERFGPDLLGCYPLNAYELVDIVRLDLHDPRILTTGFAARLSVKPLDAGADRVIGAFGHFSQAAAHGVALIGSLVYKNGTPQVARAQAKLPKFLPGPDESMAMEKSAKTEDIEVHAVSVYRGAPTDTPNAASPHAEGTVRIQVHQTPIPVGLFLSAYESVNWIVELKEGAQLARIITSGRTPQRVSFIRTTAVPVATTRYAESRQGQPSLAERAFGIKPTSLQYEYTGNSFDVGLPEDRPRTNNARRPVP